MTVLLERERELAELAALVREAAAGSGRLALIEAHAGLGKTRLVQAAREAGAAAGMRVLAARATELERDFPFALVRQLFESALAALDAVEREALFEGAAGAARGALGLAADGAPAGDTFAVLHGLYWLTAALAESRPLVLAADDAHWADAGSLDFLAFLLPRLEELPVLLVVACRPDEAGADGSLARLATDAAARRLEPRALGRAAADALLTAELGGRPAAAFAATCHEVSGGNPFLLCELARTLVAQQVEPSAAEAERVRELAPERVTRTVLVRVARLSPAARAVARALVVLGDDADHRLVAELAGLDAGAALAAADELRAAAILDPDAALRFVHPLVRNALGADIPAGRRAAMHAAAVELLRARGAGPEQLAAHLVASEPRGDRATVRTLLEAGGRALASGAPRSAIAYLTRALREPAPADLRAAVLGLLINAGIRASDASLLAAVEPELHAELERDPALRSRWGVKLSAWMAVNGRPDEATPLLEQAIEVAVQEDDVERAFRLEAQLGRIAQLTPDAARARLARYRDRIEPDSPTGRVMAALDARFALSDGTAAEAAAFARQALRHDCAILREQIELGAPGEAVLALILADELDEAARAVEQALAFARERGATGELAGAWMLSAHVAFSRGDLTAAEADARQGVDVARLGGVPVAEPVLTPALATILIARGAVAEATAELARTGLTEGPVPDSPWLHALLLARGLVRFSQGRVRDAADDFVELHRRNERLLVGGSPLLPAGCFAAIALTACGEPARARELAEAELAGARRWGAASGVSFALTALAMATGGEQGIALLREAVAVLDGAPRDFRRVLALVELGAALRRANRRAEARAPLREGLELARRAGAIGLAKQAHDELLATGEKVRRWTPIGVESLTPSERRVAEMAASGMTNRQIAQALFLTVKTIETHLGAAYDKLGIRSRRQLPDALGEPAPLPEAVR